MIHESSLCEMKCDYATATFYCDRDLIPVTVSLGRSSTPTELGSMDSFDYIFKP